MKKLFLAFVTVAMLATTASAQTMYISDDIKITLRTGQGTDHKIISMISSSQPIKILEEGPDWTRVRLSSGQEGWIVNRFVTDKVPAGITLTSLKRRYETVSKKAAALTEERLRLQDENDSLKQSLAETQTKFSDLDELHTNLVKESSGYLTLKKKHHIVTRELNSVKNESTTLSSELNSLKRDKKIYWFIAGGVLLLVGMLIGASSKSSGRGRSSMGLK